MVRLQPDGADYRYAACQDVTSKRSQRASQPLKHASMTTQTPSRKRLENFSQNNRHQVISNQKNKLPVPWGGKLLLVVYINNYIYYQ